jgi:hypothetical protein
MHVPAYRRIPIDTVDLKSNVCLTRPLNQKAKSNFHLLSKLLVAGLSQRWEILVTSLGKWDH